MWQIFKMFIWNLGYLMAYQFEGKIESLTLPGDLKDAQKHFKWKFYILISTLRTTFYKGNYPKFGVKKKFYYINGDFRVFWGPLGSLYLPKAQVCAATLFRGTGTLGGSDFKKSSIETGWNWKYFHFCWKNGVFRLFI